MSKQSAVDNIDAAVAELKALLARGIEWPDAEYKVRATYNLTEKQWEHITELYDEED